MTKSRVSRVGGLLGTLFLMGACGEAGLDFETTDVETTDDEQIPLVNGTATTVRPEVGRLSLDCTATLIHPRYVLTAAHCFNYENGSNRQPAFWMWDTSGVPIGPSPKVDRAYMTALAPPNTPGSDDVAIARLALDVPASVAVPAAIGGAWTLNEQVSAFGFGCTNRTTLAGKGTKWFLNYVTGGVTAANCSGDSGGPRFHGFHTANGAVWGVNSGFDGNGRDVNADAWAYAPRMLQGVLALGGTTRVAAAVSTFPLRSRAVGAKVVAGDFNGDSLGDAAVLGATSPSSTTVTVAMGNGSGVFTVTDLASGNFGLWAQSATHVVAADFDNDRDTDIALLGLPSTFTQIPIALSNRNGTFTIQNWNGGNIPSWSRTSGAKVVAGDFNADGRGDLALAGGLGWTTVPVGLSNGSGTFTVHNNAAGNFHLLSRVAGVRLHAGDFDNDMDADLALTGGEFWPGIPLARSNGQGSFTEMGNSTPNFASWSRQPNVKIAVGDFDGDSDADLAAVGASGRALNFALSNANGTFTEAVLPHPALASQASAARFALGFSAGFDSTWDLLLTGAEFWTSIPLALFMHSENTIVSQSSTATGGVAQLAHDGDFGTTSATLTESQPSWNADVGELTVISSVDVYGFLTNFSISVSPNGGDWTTRNFSTSGPSNKTTATFGGLNRYVRIQRTGTTSLALTEVDIKTQ